MKSAEQIQAESIERLNTLTRESSPRPDGLSDALSGQLVGYLTSGKWVPLMIAGGLALKSAKPFLRAFDIQDEPDIVIVVCRRKK